MPSRRDERCSPSGSSSAVLRKPLALLLFVAAALGIAHLGPLGELFGPSRVGELRDRIAELGALAPWAFVALGALAVGLGVPRLWLALLGGVLFGWWRGTLLAQAGTMIGATATFLIAGWLGRDFVRGRIGARFESLGHLMEGVGRHGILANLLIRWFPLGSGFATNLFMGVSPVRFRDFLIGTFLGTLPETAIAALAGSGAGGEAGARVGGALFLLALLFVAALLFGKRRMARLAEGADQASGPGGTAP